MVAGVFAKSVSKSMSHPRHAGLWLSAAAGREEKRCIDWRGEMVNGALRGERAATIMRVNCRADGHRRKSGLSDPLPGGAVLRNSARHEIVDREHFGHAGGGMSRAPDIAPARRAVFPRADVDILADI